MPFPERSMSINAPKGRLYKEPQLSISHLNSSLGQLLDILQATGANLPLGGVAQTGCPCRRDAFDK